MLNMFMKCVPLVVLLTILLLFWTMAQVGRARARTGVKAPATSGPPEFERAFRVQMNTIEQTVMFLPAFWLCATYFRADVAVIAGFVWIIGRVLFALGYYQAAEKRGVGFMVSFFSFVALALGGGFGAIRLFFQ
jgi:glutathione S-transferase